MVHFVINKADQRRDNMSPGLAVILIGILIVALFGVIVAYKDDHPGKTKLKGRQNK